MLPSPLCQAIDGIGKTKIYPDITFPFLAGLSIAHVDAPFAAVTHGELDIHLMQMPLELKATSGQRNHIRCGRVMPHAGVERAAPVFGAHSGTKSCPESIEGASGGNSA